MAIYRDQTGTIENKWVASFYNDVVNGLRASPKHLQSKYFYDEAGDRLFQQIMECPEYYLTRCELEIFSQQIKDLAHTFLDRYKEFDVVELGAGDATKSIYLLRYLSHMGFDFTYYPVDISANVINLLEKNIPEQIPGLQVKGLNGEYVEMIRAANKISNKRKLVLFLGSNIGNFTREEALHFLKNINKSMVSGDLMLIGFDLKKDPRQILAAYNDARGITKAFNLNLLKRINRELDADFDESQFEHFPVYDPVSGACKSYLISLRQQSVTIADSEVIRFDRFEPVQMELSQKYSLKEIDEIATHTGFKPVEHFYDNRECFLDAVWEKQ
ncbi:MAG TPA: L-histidine N(alpha)-methyltransferase [Flavisolibacter sp.]|nr:L-histidine N(alpha)-methyltransferase [Flavisolibacter sp.]